MAAPISCWNWGCTNTRETPEIGAANHILLDGQWDEYETQNPDVPLDTQNLAYMIYTSGSTGVPKGAANTHGAIANRILWMHDAYGLEASDRILQKTPFSFDVSVWEFFWPLMMGARLVIAKPGGHRDGVYLGGLIEDEGITRMHFVPSMLAAFLDVAQLGETSSLQQVYCSGEALSRDLQERFFVAFKETQLHNLYGPTEAADTGNKELARNTQRYGFQMLVQNVNTQVGNG